MLGEEQQTLQLPGSLFCRKQLELNLVHFYNQRQSVRVSKTYGTVSIVSCLAINMERSEGSLRSGSFRNIRTCMRMCMHHEKKKAFPIPAYKPGNPDLTMSPFRVCLDGIHTRCIERSWRKITPGHNCLRFMSLLILSCWTKIYAHKPALVAGFLDLGFGSWRWLKVKFHKNIKLALCWDVNCVF